MIVWVSIALFLLYLVIFIIVTARWHYGVTIKNRPSGVIASHVSDPASHVSGIASHDVVTASHVSGIASHDNVTHWKETSLSRVVSPRGGEPTLDKPDILPWETEPERLPLRTTVLPLETEPERLHDLDYIPAPTYLAPTPQVPYSKSVSVASQSEFLPSYYLLSPDAKNEEEWARFKKSQIEHDPQMLKFMEQYPKQRATIQQLINFRGQLPSETILTSAFLMVETLSYANIPNNVIQRICEYALNGTTVGELCLSQFKARLEMHKDINGNVYLWGNANFNAFLTIVQECKKQGSTNVAPTPIKELPRDIALMVKYMICPKLAPSKGFWQYLFG